MRYLFELYKINKIKSIHNKSSLKYCNSDLISYLFALILLYKIIIVRWWKHRCKHLEEDPPQILKKVTRWRNLFLLHFLIKLRRVNTLQWMPWSTPSKKQEKIALNLIKNRTINHVIPIRPSKLSQISPLQQIMPTLPKNSQLKRAITHSLILKRRLSVLFL